MKRTKLGPKTYQEALLKRSQKPKIAPKRTKLRKTNKVTKKGYYKQIMAENNHWIKHIPPGSHGSTPLQKRLWRLVTDGVRIRDFLKSRKCCSCNHIFTDWKEAQGGHYRAFSKCKGYYKFDYRNVFAQCMFCNSRMNDDKFYGGKIFADTIIERYGQERLDTINSFTQGEPVKLEIPVLIKMMKAMIELIGGLEVKPDYYHKLNLDNIVI